MNCLVATETETESVTRGDYNSPNNYVQSLSNTTETFTLLQATLHIRDFHYVPQHNRESKENTNITLFHDFMSERKVNKEKTKNFHFNITNFIFFSLYFLPSSKELFYSI